MLHPTIDRLREVSRRLYGITVEIVLIRVSLDSVTSSVFRLVDLVIRIAIILSSPLVWGELLNPDTLRYASCDVNVDSVLTKCEYSAHSPSIELQGMLKDRVPILTNLLINSYFKRWLGIDMLCQNLSAVRTN